MTTTIEAVYQGGVFRPMRPVTLAEGTHVEVVIVQSSTAPDPRAAAAAIARLAGAAPRTGSVERTSENHDQVLYGKRG